MRVLVALTFAVMACASNSAGASLRHNHADEDLVISVCSTTNNVGAGAGPKTSTTVCTINTCVTTAVLKTCQASSATPPYCSSLSGIPGGPFPLDQYGNNAKCSATSSGKNQLYTTAACATSGGVTTQTVQMVC